MSTRAAAWLAWSLGGLSLVMFVASFVLYFLLRAHQVPGSRGSDLSVGALLGGGLFLIFPLVGALIASRRPDNAIGWICLAVGLLWMLIGVSDVYGAYGVAQPGSVPFPVVVAGINNWLWVPAVGLLGTYLLLLFPEGRLPSRRWRPFAWFSGAVLVLASVGVMLSPGPLQGLGGVRNPFGLEGQQWLPSAGYAVLPLLPLCMLVSALSLVLRFRRSRGEERQQIKWIAFAASVVVIVYLIAMVASLLSPAETWFTGTSPAWLNLLQSAALLSLTAVPISVGIAVLRYRLYDIDIIINRALIYGSLTATLALAYVGGVVVLQAMVRAISGQESSLAVVGSTLAIAALFGPLRRGVQELVDRRFYRRKYDAAKTLEAFTARLREETDLNALTDEVTSVIRGTMQPAHVTLWLRPDPEPAAKSADLEQFGHEE
jgi:fumarate reductase subunit C